MTYIPDMSLWLGEAQGWIVRPWGRLRTGLFGTRHSPRNDCKNRKKTRHCIYPQYLWKRHSSALGHYVVAVAAGLAPQVRGGLLRLMSVDVAEPGLDVFLRACTVIE